VPSRVRLSNPGDEVAFSFANSSAIQSCLPKVSATDNSQVTALSIEFVAKPHEAHRAQLAIPSALAGALKEVTGFDGCLVMTSDQEARLLTEVTLWSGNERQKLCKENLRWVRALLATYLDRCLRVQILNAHLPSLAATLPAPDDADDSSVEDCPSSEKKPLLSPGHLIVCGRSAS
jgi:hypothetical protein